MDVMSRKFDVVTSYLYRTQIVVWQPWNS